MKEKAFTLDRGKRYLFYILMIAILGWFLFMQFFGADERSQEMSSGPVIYSGTYIWQKSDGTSEKITVPGKYKVPAGETMVLISQLPDTLQETDIAIRSSLQDVNVYINNELRTSYSTRETRLAGKNSASRYIFCPVSSSDAGKQLRIELTTYTSNYSGVVNTIYCGNTAVYSLSSAEDGKLYVANLNKGIAKDRGEAVQSDFDIDSRRKKIEKKAKAGKQNGGSVENEVQAGAIPEAG